MRRLQFWFEFASTYSYLAAMRIEALATAAGTGIELRPFLLGPIFAAQGWSTSPFNLYEAKGRYMWRDLERLCERYGLAFRKPSVFPRNGLTAARVTLAFADADWALPFVRAAYTANFAEDREIDRAEVIAELLENLGQDARSVLEHASNLENKARLREQTEAAQVAGIFGAPSFIVDGELFWGGDRLEHALAYRT